MIHRIHGKPPVPESKFEKAQREARVTQPTRAEKRTWNEQHHGWDVEGDCWTCGSPVTYFVDEDGTPRNVRSTALAEEQVGHYERKAE